MHFLTSNISPETRGRAIHSTFQSLHEKWTSVLDDPVAHIGGAICTTWGNSVCLVRWPLRPRIETTRLIDELVAHARNLQSQELRICCRLPVCPIDLPVRLAARSFVWMLNTNREMFLDCRRMIRSTQALRGIAIEILDVPPKIVGDDLPSHRKTLIRFFEGVLSARPRRDFYFGAFDDKGLVGNATLHVISGEYGIGILGNVGVRPRGRGQGTGSALIQAVGEHAVSLGCRYIWTNASKMGQSVYRRVGYEFIPGTQDWRISEKALYADPSRAEIDFLEAVGRGDMRCLAGKSKRRLLEANKSDTTPLDISIKVAHSLKLCDALLSTGASPDGDGYWHPLIIAAEENLPEIASLLIQKGADPSAKDTEGRTARSVVEDYGHKETFGILVN